MDLALYLRTLPEFAHLDDAPGRRLAEAMTESQHPKGHLFVKQGHLGDTAWFVVEGHVAVRQSKGGESETVTVLGPGESFGLHALLAQDRSKASHVAHVACTVAALPHAAMLRLASEDASISCALQLSLAAGLARDFVRIDQRVRQVSSEKDWFLSKAWWDTSA